MMKQLEVASYRQVNDSFHRRMVCHVGIDSGFFVEFQYMVNAMLYCLTHRVRFQIYADDANYGTGIGWTEYFRYIDACGSCPRLLYWSNPNVLYNGIPMGTSSTHDNSRVWNERSNTVMAFRQPDNNVTFTSSDMPNTQYADVIAKQNITTSGTVNTNNGNTLNMRAGNSINLQPGFSVQTGAEFSAGIEDIDDCEDCASNASKVIVQNIPDVYDEKADIRIKSESGFSYKVFPDSSNEFINITYSLDTEESLSIELVDLFGKKIKTILPKQDQQAGNYALQVPVSEFSIGSYFLTISSSNQTRIEKIIINK